MVQEIDVFNRPWVTRNNYRSIIACTANAQLSAVLGASAFTSSPYLTFELCSLRFRLLFMSPSYTEVGIV